MDGVDETPRRGGAVFPTESRDVPTKQIAPVCTGAFAFYGGVDVYLINFIFNGGPALTPYVICSGDANGDCVVNVGDAVYQINYIFKGGPAPVTCDQWRTGCGALGKN